MANKFKFVLGISISILIWLKVGPVTCQDKECISVSGKSFVCKLVTECKEIQESLRRWTRPIPDNVKKALRSLACGFEGMQPKMCCRAQPQFIHRNLQLLANQTCGASNEARIFGGSETNLSEFPWMALLGYEQKKGNMEFQCGASIISKRYVLTAAHCITEQLVGVRLGEHNIETQFDCSLFLETTYCSPPVQDMLIEDTIIHEGYDSKDITNDIALIRLTADIDFTQSNVMSVCLPIYQNLLDHKLEGVKAIVAGWGATELQNFKSSPVLLQVAVDIMSNEECKAHYRRSMKTSAQDPVKHITEYKFCAGVKGKDSCRGDSGGPIAVAASYEGRSRYVQFGIVSYGHRVCATGIPGVYTNILKYMKWILDNLKP